MADGQTAGYLQLAHNEWDPVAKVSRTKVLYSFGREDQLDVEGIRQLKTRDRPPGSRARRAAIRETTDTRLMTGPELDPEQYPPIDPREPVPDDAGLLLPGAPDELPEAPAEPMPDDDGNAGGVREPA